MLHGVSGTIRQENLEKVLYQPCDHGFVKMEFRKMGAPSDEDNVKFDPASSQEPAPVANDQNFLAPAATNTAARLRAEAADALARMAALSPREREVVDCIAQGLSIKEIAGHLAVSPKSVETYRARLIEKLDAKSPAALMRIAVLVSLIAPPGEPASGPWALREDGDGE
jgi:DNA-binding CsgD family transcriptional regulator